MPGRTFTREFKLDLCRQLANGDKRPAQVCREHSIDASLLNRWRNEYRSRSDQAFTPRASDELSPSDALLQRVADLERHCGQLSLENALLRKLVSSLQSGSGTK